MSSLQKGMTLISKTEKSYTLIAPLVQREIPNVWKASLNNNTNHQFVIKHPQSDNSPGAKWPAFQKEMETQNLFSDAKFIRRMVDTIPPRSNLELPMMVLEPFEKTLWSARTKRPFTTREVKHVMKSALLGLWEVHRRGLVYCGMVNERRGGGGGK